MYRKVFDKQIRDKNSGFIKVPELQKFYKYVLYIDLMEPFLLSNASIPAAHELSLDFNVRFYEFLKKAPKRFEKIEKKLFSFL